MYTCSLALLIMVLAEELQPSCKRAMTLALVTVLSCYKNSMKIRVRQQTHKPYTNNDINLLALVTFPFTMAISVISMNKHEKKTFYL